MLRPRRVRTSYGPLRACWSSPTATSALPGRACAQRGAPCPEPHAASPSSRCLDIPPPPAQLQDTLSHHQPFAGFILERFINFSDCSKPRGAFCGWGKGGKERKGLPKER